jgi:hypothetical protein
MLDSGMTKPCLLSAFVFLILLAAVCSTPARADYRQQAEEQMDYIQAHFYDAPARRYHSRWPDDLKGLPYAFSWDNGVQWRALVDAARYQPAKYDPLLETYGEGLHQYYWDPQVAIPGFNAYCSGPGGDDKYYDDNAWLALGFLEAYAQTHQPKYLLWANETQAFVLSGWDEKLGGGIYWKLKHESKNTCVNAPAAVSALRLSVLGKEPDQLVWGQRLIAWTQATLQDKDGLYWDNIRLDSSIEKHKWTYNTALMIEANVLLYQLHHDRRDLAEAERLADASIAAWQDPETGRFQDDAKFSHLLCESLIRVYEADHQLAYLNAVRRHAAYGYRVVRDSMNRGYWSDWRAQTHKPDEAKSLIENASDARLLWLLTPYPDSTALYPQGLTAAGHGKDAQAENLFRQAANSDTDDVEARFRLWKVLLREKKTAAAAVEEKTLAKRAENEPLRKRLEAVGWRSQSPPVLTPIRP